MVRVADIKVFDNRFPRQALLSGVESHIPIRPKYARPVRRICELPCVIAKQPAIVIELNADLAGICSDYCAA